jgi:hypothetical protein
VAGSSVSLSYQLNMKIELCIALKTKNKVFAIIKYIAKLYRNNFRKKLETISLCTIRNIFKNFIGTNNTQNIVNKKKRSLTNMKIYHYQITFQTFRTVSTYSKYLLFEVINPVIYISM